MTQEEVKEGKESLLSSDLSFNSSPPASELERIEKANKELRELLKVQQDILDKQRLGGRSYGGGIEVIPKSKEQLLDEEIDRMFQGTGLDPLKSFRKKV